MVQVCELFYANPLRAIARLNDSRRASPLSGFVAKK